MEKNNFKKAEVIVDVPRQTKANGLSIAQLNHHLLMDYLDPYLMFDHFEMAQPFFPPHPHAGFSAVTYMFPESKNGFQNLDSLGDRHQIPPGAIHWTAAGRGVVHEEVPLERGVICHGLQIFINLHSSKKMMEPMIHHLDPQEVPLVKTITSEVRVVVGSHEGKTSPLSPPTDVVLFDVWLQPGGVFKHSFLKKEIGFVYSIGGTVHIGNIGSCETLNEHQACGFGEDGEILQVAAQDHPVHFVVGAGVPLREPVVFYGPFCMNTKAQIEEALRNYQTGKMGSLTPSFALENQK